MAAATASASALSPLADRYGELEAEAGRIDQEIAAADLATSSAELASSMARRDVLKRELAKRRPALDAAQEAAKRDQAAQDAADVRLRDAQRVLDRLMRCEDADVTSLSIREWRVRIAAKRRSIAELAPDLAAVEMPGIPPLEGH